MANPLSAGSIILGSGLVTVTGGVLYIDGAPAAVSQAQLNALSGVVGTSGSQLYAMLTGESGALVARDSAISGALQTLIGAVVPSVNGITSAVSITGTGGFSVAVIGSSIVVSGLTTTTNKQIVFDNQKTLSGDANFTWDTTSGALIIGQGYPTGGTTLDSTSLRLGLGTISGAGLAGKPGITLASTGWGNTFYQSAFYDNRSKFFSPALTTSQSAWGDTTANVGTLSTPTSEALGDYSLFTPAVGLSAGGTSTTATIYRGSVLGLNGFFFSSKFILNTAWASGRATSVYAEPSGCRIFVGLTDQLVATQVSLNEPIGNFVGLQYLYASGGAVGTGQYMQNWAVTSRNNVATSTGNSAMSFQTGFYRFSMYCPPFPNNTTVNWELKDIIRGSGVVGTITNTLPVGSTPMRPMVAIGFVSGLKAIGFTTLYVEKRGD